MTELEQKVLKAIEDVTHGNTERDFRFPEITNECGCRPGQREYMQVQTMLMALLRQSKLRLSPKDRKGHRVYRIVDPNLLQVPTGTVITPTGTRQTRSRNGSQVNRRPTTRSRIDDLFDAVGGIYRLLNDNLAKPTELRVRSSFWERRRSGTRFGNRSSRRRYRRHNVRVP